MEGGDETADADECEGEEDEDEGEDVGPEDVVAARAGEELSEETTDGGGDGVEEDGAEGPGEGGGDCGVVVFFGVVVEDGADEEEIDDAGDGAGVESAPPAFGGESCGDETAEENHGDHEGDGDLAGGLDEGEAAEVGGDPDGGGDAEAAGEDVAAAQMRKLWGSFGGVVLQSVGWGRFLCHGLCGHAFLAYDCRSGESLDSYRGRWLLVSSDRSSRERVSQFNGTKGHYFDR